MIKNQPNPYENWEVEKWNTPFSDTTSLTMVALIDSVNLNIIVENTRDKLKSRWTLCFDTFVAYNNILEEYRTKMWKRLHETSKNLGNTFLVVNSPWIAQISSAEPLIDVFAKDLIHFVLATEDDVIEILSPQHPDIQSIESGLYDSSDYGKSTTYYSPDDRKQIEEILSDARGNKNKKNSPM